MPEKEWIAGFDVENRMRVRFLTRRGKVERIWVVQYEALIRGKWVSLLRFDSAHGYLHRDVLLEHPEAAPPSGAHVIELPHNDPALLEANLALAVHLARKVAGGEETGPVVLLPEVDGHVPAESW